MKMRSSLVFLAALSLCQARPQAFIDCLRPSHMMGGEQYIVGGTDASPGEFPWQLGQEVRKSGTWSFFGGASMLSSYYGLCAAHNVDGTLSSNLRAIAGMHKRSNLTGTQIVNISSYTMHEGYQMGNATVANDIAILKFSSSVVIGGNIQPAVLPADNTNSCANRTCIITGWGDTIGGLVSCYADTLQKAFIQVIDNAMCQTQVAVYGGVIWKKQICVYDAAQKVGACTGDSGGPLNCLDEGGNVNRVIGVASWVIANTLIVFYYGCDQSYPSVYTRVSEYLDWIQNHTSPQGNDSS